MSKFHVNDQGEPGRCSAQKGGCPFGGDAQHYPTKEVAQQAYELSMAASIVPAAAKKKASSPSVKMPTSGAYDVGSKAERYVHPQGKVVEINPDGTVTAWKNGKLTPTSATAEKLRAGYGAWKRADADSIDSRPDSGAVVTSKSPSKNKKSEQILTPAEASEKERVELLKLRGYPKTSGLDPRNVPARQDREPRRDPFSPSDFRKGRAVLPTGTRINPHVKPETNEFVEGWKEGSVIAVVRAPGQNRDFIYRSILSGHDGVSSDVIGDRFPLEHDQTMARIGSDQWVVVGLYEPRQGGAVEGEVPNQKIPFYVYK